jgi:hypothetical protein
MRKEVMSYELIELGRRRNIFQKGEQTFVKMAMNI